MTIPYTPDVAYDVPPVDPAVAQAAANSALISMIRDLYVTGGAITRQEISDAFASANVPLT